MFNKIAGFTLNSSDKNNSFTETYIAQASSSKERLAGKLFILSDIVGNQNDCQKLSAFIISTLDELYYNDEKIILREKLDKIKIENIFESALSKANEKIYQFLEEEKLIDRLENINLFAGVIFNEEVYFSQAGSSQTMVLYKKNKLYEFMPVSSQDEALQKINYREIFSSLVSGNVPPGSFFIVSNEALAEYITTETLKEVICVLPPMSAIFQIKNKLKEINNRVSFAGIIVKNNFGQVDSDSSSTNVVNVQYSEEKTSNILSTAGALSHKKIKTLFTNLFLKLKPKKKDPRIVASPKKNNENNIIKNDKEVKKVKPKVLNLKDKIIFGKKPGLFSSIKKILPISYLKNRDNWHFSGKNFSKKNKAILVIVLLLILTFSINIILSKQKSKKIAKQEQYQEEVSQIEQKQNQIDSYLLYKNEDSAKTLIKESYALIESLNRESKLEEENYNKYISKHQTQLEAVRHATSPNYTEVITLAQDASVASFGLNSEGLIYVSDSKNKKIYLVNIENKNLQSLDIVSDNDLSLKFTLTDRYNNLYFLNNSNFTQLLMPEKTINSLSYELPSDAGEISAASSFLDNFYLFDKDNKQLYKYLKSNSNISFSTNWLNSTSSLDDLDITDIAIDGSIYFLTKNGDVKKFYTGDVSDFKINSVEPNIENAEKLIISGNFLYIFEPQANRLIKYGFTDESPVDRHEAKFISQYEIKNLDNLENIVIAEDNKSAYLLANKKIYLLSLENIE